MRPVLKKVGRRGRVAEFSEKGIYAYRQKRLVWCVVEVAFVTQYADHVWL